MTAQPAHGAPRLYTPSRPSLPLWPNPQPALPRYACVPDPELDMFTSTTKYTWQEVANSDELGQFLTEAGISSTKQRSKLERLLHRDGFDTLGDLHGMSSANLQVYLNKGVPHMNVLKLVEYIHEVWEAHGHEKIADLAPPATPNGMSEGAFASLDTPPPAFPSANPNHP